jgi:8-oxo-dGTP pyrophosphatase MutT (NUDIX family)
MSELIDLVNSHGVVVKSGVTRDDATDYQDTFMQIVIAVIRNAAGEFLVHKRSMAKHVNPGDIDHVCGGIHSGETPEASVAREALEEGGVRLHTLNVVRQGINQYNRYCYLVEGYTADTPDISQLDPQEVEWVAFHPYQTLMQGKASGIFTFVDGFFEDIAHVTGPAAAEQTGV